MLYIVKQTMLNPFTRCISEEKCIVAQRHLACRRELAEGDQLFHTLCESTVVGDSPHFLRIVASVKRPWKAKCSL